MKVFLYALVCVFAGCHNVTEITTIEVHVAPLGTVDIGRCQGQVHSIRDHTDSAYSTGYQTEWMVLEGWGSVNLSNLAYFSYF